MRLKLSLMRSRRRIKWLGEVLRIKELLENHQEDSDGVLFDSLRRLELMQLFVETLQATEISKAVSGLKRHNSKKIRHLVRTLIEGWKTLVSQWLNATAAITDGTADSVLISAEEEDEGLPFPPLDEGALLATQTTTIELSKFFDGMDDDGNLQANGQQDRNGGQRIPQQNHNTKRKQPPPRSSAPPEVRGQPRRPVAEVKQTTYVENYNLIDFLHLPRHFIQCVKFKVVFMSVIMLNQLSVNQPFLIS